jgi:excisionase family DNA binding protein
LAERDLLWLSRNRPFYTKIFNVIFGVAGVRRVLPGMTTIEELRSRPGCLGVLAASKLIGRSKKTLNKWINAGTFHAYRIGNANKIDRSYLAAWLEERELAACPSL